jgi:hypothetical protein
MKDGTHTWVICRKGRSDRRKTTSGGYGITYPSDISDALLPMYRSMQSCGQPLMSHRWEMSKFLGRALTSEELVDHMNGNKTDNRVSVVPLENNLRLYVRGKQQAGSAPGHGTYYHEWQMALKRITDLEVELDRVVSANN